MKGGWGVVKMAAHLKGFGPYVVPQHGYEHGQANGRHMPESSKPENHEWEGGRTKLMMACQGVGQGVPHLQRDLEFLVDYVSVQPLTFLLSSTIRAHQVPTLVDQTHRQSANPLRRNDMFGLAGVCWLFAHPMHFGANSVPFLTYRTLQVLWIASWAPLCTQGNKKWARLH